tara:strand:+ start:404 stop:925 length:522 start_codon:yes stop_codon:yes gene_type:complete
MNNDLNYNNVDLSSLENYAYILKLLEEENNEDKENNEGKKVKLCLISGEKLNKDHISLECGHEFNYEPIINEIKQQKENKRINYLETTVLKKYQIKCPYCRNVQNSLLPYLHGFPKIKKVNYPLNKTYMPHKCKYTFKRGVNKNKPCDKKCYGEYCTTHHKLILKKKNKQKQQ